MPHTPNVLNCIKVYRNVSKCILTYQSVSKRIKVYPNVLKCILMYRSVLKRIVPYVFFDVLALNEQLAFDIERFIHSKGINMRMIVLS